MDESALPRAVAGLPPEMCVRELGGLRGAGGRPVRHGIFFRGSALVGLSAKQEQVVDSLGLVSILDLRAADEAQQRTEYLPKGVKYLRVGAMYDESGEEVDFSPAGIARMLEYVQGDDEGFMPDLYASMMFDNPAVHELVRIISDEQVPLYLHCSAGKDRTGVCSAIILMLLGVSDDDIVQDYLLTNEYRDSVIHMSPDELPKDLSDAGRAHWEQIQSVNEDDLRAAFAAVDAKYDSREAYFVDELGLDAEALSRLRDRYLVSSNMPELPAPQVNPLASTPFLKVYDLEYEDDTHYYVASRRGVDDLRAVKTAQERGRLLPDAVGCCLVMDSGDAEPRLLLFYEYRYPTGGYVLSIPSGLVDETDRQRRDPLVAAMVREVYEETGIAFGAKDSIFVINPLLYNSPGLTDESCALLCAVIRGTDTGGLSQAGANGAERFSGFELVTRKEALSILSRGRDKYGNHYPLITWAALMYFVSGQWRR